MPEAAGIILLVSLFSVALLYASVGHGGASGYIALMTLFNVEVWAMRSSALLLNLFVSFIAFAQYYRQGHFKWKLFYPFAITSIPFSFIGSQFKVEAFVYNKVIGVLLLISIARLLWTQRNNLGERREMNMAVALFSGACIGLLSGMIGIGGGIILSPLILLLHWAGMKETAATSALFIFVNSLAGLAGLLSSANFVFPEQTGWWLVMTLAGGLIGSYWGSRLAAVKHLRYVLALGLTLASLKLLFA